MKTAWNRASCLAGACLVAMPGAAFAQDSEVEKNESPPASIRLNTGISYSSGEYGELEDTEVIAVPVSLTYKKDGFKLRVSVPWVHIEGPGSLIATPEGRDSFFDGGSGSGQGRGRGRGGDSDNSGSGSSGNDIEVEDELDDDVIDPDDLVDRINSRSGLGDVNVSALYSFRLARGTYFEPQVKVKLPTASRSKRLGTGEVDVTLGADLVQVVGGATFYVHGRRKFAGKPEGSTIRSTWGAGGGASFKAADGVYVGADYSWQQSAFVGREASSEVSGWFNTRLSDSLSLTVYAGTGLSDNSANLFGGASVGFRF